jgi:hypothetical protein
MAETTVERVELDDGTVLVCHHPREGIWCCCAENDGVAAQCCCASNLESAVTAWVRNDNCGE